MRIWIVFFFIFIIGCSTPFNVVEGPVMRSFSTSTLPTDGTIVITLTKTLQADQTNILIEEYVPSGLTIVDKGTGTVAGNTIRWIELTGAKSGDYVYTVKSSGIPGSAEWRGQYSINGQASEDIGGSKILTAGKI